MVKQYIILTYICACKFKLKKNFYGHISFAEEHLACPSCRANNLQLASYEIVCDKNA